MRVISSLSNHVSLTPDLNTTSLTIVTSLPSVEKIHGSFDDDVPSRAKRKSATAMPRKRVGGPIGLQEVWCMKG
jgi:hypothetical protein